MSTITFIAMSTEDARAYQNGSPDANGQLPEVHVSDGNSNPCRHCLEDIAAGEEMLVFAHRPFPEPQPYAEVGPIFLHKEACSRGGNSAETPPILTSPTYILRGYSEDNRIVYGTGNVVKTGELLVSAETLFQRDDIQYLHIRSASNNCFQVRVERD